ncbi:hypothetical protein MUK42_34756 [Musa troglodytarum]|uniref:Uncharacterized protein n=1 Tax=Musa troglodytarum TaxID=320322 RepID=A0A9E7EE34_9LILI|nr:hypothetical protein MUK42_34756 [Musa troglodytarum]
MSWSVQVAVGVVEEKESCQERASAATWLVQKQTHSLPPPPAAAAALFFAKYSSARARFFATDGFTHFFRPGNAVSVQPAASNFSLAAAEKARAFTFTLTDKAPSPRI